MLARPRHKGGAAAQAPHGLQGAVTTAAGVADVRLETVAGVQRWTSRALARGVAGVGGKTAEGAARGAQGVRTGAWPRKLLVHDGSMKLA